MKNLLIMRHAKSAYPADVVDDLDRPLNKRGRDDAPLMGRVLKARGPAPETVACSAAVRAVETGRAVTAESGLPASDLHLDERLYLASPDVLSQVAAETPDAVATLLLIAHNPGMEEWIELLCGANVRFPTAALALVGLPLTRWLDISRVRGQLQWLIVPRLVKKII